MSNRGACQKVKFRLKQNRHCSNPDPSTMGKEKGLIKYLLKNQPAKIAISPTSTQ
jgi:hypothetical protein